MNVPPDDSLVGRPWPDPEGDSYRRREGRHRRLPLGKGQHTAAPDIWFIMFNAEFPPHLAVLPQGSAWWWPAGKG